MQIKDKEIYELRHKNTTFEMQIAELRNQMHRITDMEGVNTEMQQGMALP